MSLLNAYTACSDCSDINFDNRIQLHIRTSYYSSKLPVVAKMLTLYMIHNSIGAFGCTYIMDTRTHPFNPFKYLIFCIFMPKV